MGLNRLNGTLKGVKGLIYDEHKDEWQPQSAVGWLVDDGERFFLGLGEVENGYEAEITLSRKALKRILKELETHVTKEVADKTHVTKEVADKKPFSERPKWLEDDAEMHDIY